MKMIYLIIIILAAVVIFEYYKQHKLNKYRNYSRISFKESMDLTELPVVVFTVDGVKVNFLLDTGSNVSYINKSFLPKIRHRFLDTTSNTVGIGGDIVKNRHCALKLNHDQFEFEEAFSVMNMDEAFGALKQETGVNIHGIIGSLFFQKYGYVLNFKDLTAYME